MIVRSSRKSWIFYSRVESGLHESRTKNVHCPARVRRENQLFFLLHRALSIVNQLFSVTTIDLSVLVGFSIRIR